MQTKIENKFNALLERSKKNNIFSKNNNYIIQIGAATCENAAGSKKIKEKCIDFIEKNCSNNRNIILHEVGCTGYCSNEPIVSLFTPNTLPMVFKKLSEKNIIDVLNHYILNEKNLSNDFIETYEFKYETTEKNHSQSILQKHAITKNFLNAYGSFEFYKDQCRIALRNIGLIDPQNIDEYINCGGFFSLSKILKENNPDFVIKEVLKSKLRGRGGGGFPTGKKWEFCRLSKDKNRYVVCNADEGDPGAFMDRSMLESDPFSIVEGMIIAGFAVSAQNGFFYIRAEYPLAIERIKNAIKICKENNLLGKNILGSSFNFEISIRLGAGAFVCGEETALINSIEGKRGQPNIRPPYPVQKGLWGKPTVINNVETLGNLPVIFSIGADTFSKIGTEKSGGTKVFALAGKVKNTGLVEVAIGTTLKDIVYKIGNGIENNKEFKAVQTGGPAGGFISINNIDTPVDYENLMKMGSIMGSGGMIVLDKSDCIVDVAKFYLSFTQDESCGKCTPCREGTKKMLDILKKITSGKSNIDDLEKLERLALLIKRTSLCGLGKAAPNPVISTLKEFAEEYKQHVIDKKCISKKCLDLINYSIIDSKCIGCTLCAKKCPVGCITGEKKQVHSINKENCIKCGICFEICPTKAIIKE